MNIPKVALIILNYNGAQDTIDCVQSCENNLCCSEFELKIFVVDNNSTDGGYDLLKKELNSNVDLIQSGKNFGYAAGNNIALKKARAQGFDYYCVLNNDTIVNENFLLPCIKVLKQNPKIGFIGPTIVNYNDGKVQSTGGKITLNTSRIVTQHMNEFSDYNALESSYDCDYVEGACIICSKYVLDAIGYIPECYFLFFEETEWCYKARKMGYHNVCLCTTKIKHKGSVSINNINGLSEYLLCRNQIRFVRRNHTNPFKAFIIYIKSCGYSLLTIPFRGFHRIRQLKYYTDGWKDKIDLKTYPFIYIRDENWN